MRDNPISLCVSGIPGRMGREVVRLAMLDDDFRIISGVGRKDWEGGGCSVGYAISHRAADEFGTGLQAKMLADIPFDRISRPNIVIEFAPASIALKHVARCAKHGIPIVVGSSVSCDDLLRHSNRIPIFHAPNFSIGGALLPKLGWEAADAMRKHCPDIDLVEIHRKDKRETISATAADIVKRLSPSHNCGAWPQQEVRVHSIRAGDAIGEHRLTLRLDGEEFEITHRANSRAAFARGALAAAKWLHDSNLTSGIYGMDAIV